MANRIKFEKLVNQLRLTIGDNSECIMSQRELAKRLGIPNATVCRWINRERNIKLEDAIKVCSLLNLDKKEYLDESVYEYVQISHPKSPLEERISKLSKKNQKRVFDYIDYLIYKEEQKNKEHSTKEGYNEQTRRIK